LWRCARVPIEPLHHDRLRALVAQPLDWTRVEEQAVHHGIVPLVWRHLAALGTRASDPAPFASLEAAAQEIAVRNLRFAGELLAVVEALARAGVRAAPMKGASAAVAYYGNLALRTFCDLDLLVAPADVATAWDVLAARGYRPQVPLSPGWRKVRVREEYEYLFYGPGDLLVDLHWGLMPPGFSFTPSTAELWGRLETIALGPATISTLGPEDALVFACLHGSKHDWSTLGTIADVAEIVRARPGLDWDRILAWSAPTGRRRLIDLGLTLAHGLLAAPIPEDVRQRAASDPRTAALVDEIGAVLFPPGEPGPRRGLWARTFDGVYYRAMALRRDRLRFVHDRLLLPTPLDWRVLPLPAALAPLYYGVRPVRLAAKHAWRAVVGARA
jgi:hypothetical protein